MPWTNKKAGNLIDHQRGFIQLQVRGQDVYQDYSLLHQWSRKSSWIILATFWSLYKSILQLFKPNMYEEEFPKATRTQKFPRPPGWRKVLRWKIGHGGECKAENGLRHSTLSISEWLVNSLAWRISFQYSTTQDGVGRSENGHMEETALVMFFMMTDLPIKIVILPMSTNFRFKIYTRNTAT